MIPLLKNRIFQTLAVLVLYGSSAPYLPFFYHQIFYTFSVFLKDILIFFMPIAVCFFIANTVRSFGRKSALFVTTLLCFEGVSNFCSVWYGFLGGLMTLSVHKPLGCVMLNENFLPLWRLPLEKPAWWTPDKGALIGLVMGLVCGFFFLHTSFSQFLNRGAQGIEWVLSRIFSRLIPLFILGFMASVYQMNLVGIMIKDYGVSVLYLIFFLIFYSLILFFIGSGFSMLKSMKNILPAVGVASTSGCSISTMPWTIEGTAKNLKNPNLAKAIIPATTNIQQTGDCIVQSFFCFALYVQFFGHAPDAWMWLKFTTFFVFARFATSAVLGGAIFLMIPLYVHYLNFTSEMLSVILAINVILDPIVTTFNVIGNAALCRVFEKVWTTINRSRHPGQKQTIF